MVVWSKVGGSHDLIMLKCDVCGLMTVPILTDHTLQHPSRLGYSNPASCDTHEKVDLNLSRYETARRGALQ